MVTSDLLMSWGGAYRQRLVDRFLTATNPLIQRVSSLWPLEKDPEFARQLIPSIINIIADPSEPPVLKIASLHTLGRIPNPDPAPIAQAIEKYEAQFGPLPVASIFNGDFSQSHSADLSQIPGDPKAPSILYSNWFTWKGVVGRNLAPAWGGALKIELGPRSPPGSITQVFRTIPGATYRLHFQGATGRNLRIYLSAGDLKKTCIPSSSDPAKPSRFSFEFRAQSPLTTLTFSALDFEGYGPFIDHIVVESRRR
jgi:hypothetical protein